ncbi:VOC family protein [Methylobacillus gramineus]|uniref:VOC family protein n=1 Tax=Methylobacillus gramineus TaxID=755169 RepID=UPI001CFFE197|nr:VOC family protein [Methylobacillus gramineus]MCB5184740.1 VOC family protein [Methylobacillus gramineus]
MIKINQMLHTGLIVSDIKQSRAFYEGLLGLVPSDARPELSFEGVWYDIGINQLHLMVVPNPYTEVIHPKHGGRDHHVAFAVEDVMQIKQAFDQAGIEYSMSMSGRAALFCRDPDGNALEFSAVR